MMWCTYVTIEFEGCACCVWDERGDERDDIPGWKLISVLFITIITRVLHWWWGYSLKKWFTAESNPCCKPSNPLQFSNGWLSLAQSKMGFHEFIFITKLDEFIWAGSNTSVAQIRHSTKSIIKHSFLEWLDVVVLGTKTFYLCLHLFLNPLIIWLCQLSLQRCESSFLAQNLFSQQLYWDFLIQVRPLIYLIGFITQATTWTYNAWSSWLACLGNLQCNFLSQQSCTSRTQSGTL